MQGTHDIDETTTASDDDRLDPREAARLLAQTKRDARRHFDLRPPLLSALMAAVVLAGYAVLWLSTLGQHPYSGPSPAAIVLVYVAVVISVAVSVRVYRRATVGVSGPSVRQQKLEGIAILVSFVGSPVIQGAMKYYGASHAIVYGVIPAAAPLIIVGTTVLGVAASKEDWPAVRHRARGHHSRHRRPVRGAERSVAGSRDRPVHRDRRPLRRHRDARPRPDEHLMNTDTLDPVIHAPARLRIVATLAALPAGDTLSFTRLQDMLDLTPGNLITHLRKLEDAGYLTSETTGNGRASRTSLALTGQGRTALDTYAETLRDLLSGL